MMIWVSLYIRGNEFGVDL